MRRSAAPPPVPEADERLGRLGIPLLVLLSIELLLGMALNLFVSVPGGNPAGALAVSPVLDLHVVIGVLLLGLLSNILRWALRSRDRIAVGIAGAGAGSGAVAFAAGLLFTFGSQSAGASYGMTVGFVGLMLEAAYLMGRRLRQARGWAGPRASDECDRAPADPQG